jgi:hypothetical protein
VRRETVGRGRRVLAVVAATLLLVACGGGGGGGDPVGAGGDDVARLQPGDRPVRFRLDTSVTPEEQRFIVETLAWAHTDLGDSGPLTIHVYGNMDHFVAAYTNDFAISADEARRQLMEGQTAFESGGGHLWIYLPNYEDNSELERRHVLFHEYVHTVQDWQAEVNFQSDKPQERSFVPRWMVEGCAEYLSVQAGATRRFVDPEEERALVVAVAKTTAEPLRTFETGGQAEFLGGSGDSYIIGWLGCERLAQIRGQDAVLHGFWLAMARDRDWARAFAETFGLSPADFYAGFETYRAMLS